MGVIGDDGLLGPSELGYYAGARGLGAEARRVTGSATAAGRARCLRSSACSPCSAWSRCCCRWRCSSPPPCGPAARSATGGSPRCGWSAPTTRMTRRIAAGEALVAAGLGLVLGALLFLVARANAGRLTLWELSVFPADVRPSLPLAAARGRRRPGRRGARHAVRAAARRHRAAGRRPPRGGLPAPPAVVAAAAAGRGRCSSSRRRQAPTAAKCASPPGRPRC